ncbi:hypothetical protein B0H14DRAFT_2576420 [Mycena olivaceomarginata]|nr:hypothetical protein B0H14DRAFT_2576420 [Mycena olivaceomarginata]
MPRTDETATTNQSKKTAAKLSTAKQRRHLESKRVASARYRERHRKKVLESERARAARRRAHIKTLKPGNEVLERARERARLASARYRAGNRDELALKQRQVRKRAFIHKYGLYAHIQRRFDAPIPGRKPDSEPEDADDEEDLFWGPVDPGWAPPGCMGTAQPLHMYFDMNEHKHLRKLFLLVTVHTVHTDVFLGSHVNPQPSTLGPSVDFSHLPKAAPQRLTYSEPTSASSSPVFSSPTLSILPVGLLQSSSRISMHCIPPYHESLGHEGRNTHDHSAPCLYYAVWTGRVHGVYSSSWIARDQTDGYTNGRQQSFRTWNELELWWHGLCHEQHQGACPVFEPATFTLNPPANRCPSSPACTCGFATAPPAAAVPTLQLPDDTTICQWPKPAGSPFGPSSTSSTASTSSTMSMGSAFDSCASLMGVKKEEEEEEENAPCLRLNPPPRVTPSTRVLLSPSGCAREDLLVARAAAAAPTVAASPHHEEEATPTRPTRPSVLVTPRLADAAAHRVLTPVLVPAPAPAPRVVQYRICGVAVFYPSLSSAQVAAGRPGMPAAKIMVSENTEKLQAWILGEPFLGEDDF